MPQLRVARRLLTAATGLLVAASCGGRSPSSATPPAAAASLDSAFALARQQPNLLSLVVARDNVVVRQEYFNGGGPNTPHDVRSVTKSVVSLLVGIAIDRGYLRSIDQSVGELLGPLGPSDPAKAVVTVRQLLTMTSGIGGDELADVNEYNRWVVAPNQLEYAWALPVQAAPGTRFAYFSPAYHVLSPILTQSCGRSTSNFARDMLFAPLGIGAREWETDSQGFDNGAAGLRLTPTDMVAIGNLVLNGGRAGGRQVVPAAWMADATTTRVATALRSPPGYGLGWWTGQLNGSDFACAHGYGGQFIVVVPRTRLVVTAGTRWQGIGSAANDQFRAMWDIIMQRIVPAF